MATFKLLRRDIWSGGLALGELKGFDEDFLLGRGTSVASSYPKKAPTFTVDKAPVTAPGPERADRGKSKASNALTDLLRGGDPTILVVSARLKELVAKVERRVEFLPVVIKGHAASYFIANVLEHVACLDLKKSGAKVDANGKVTRLKKLVLQPAAVPADRALFQLQENADYFLVRDDLAAALAAASLTGLEILELAEFVPT